jgi:hypothetical protein
VPVLYLAVLAIEPPVPHDPVLLRATARCCKHNKKVEKSNTEDGNAAKVKGREGKM